MNPRLLCTALLLIAGTLGQGCVSVAYQTSLPPRTETHPGFKGVKYSFSRVSMKKTSPADKFGGEPAEIIPNGLDDETWRRLLTDVAVRRHPELFTKDAPSVPLIVDIAADTDNSLGYSITAEVCTLCILGGVLPLPVSSDADLTVSVRSAERAATPSSSFDFKRKDRSWISIFTPLALIPYPARSDFSRSTLTLPGMMNKQSMEKLAKEVYDRTLESIVEGTVRILEKDPKAFGSALRTPRPMSAPSASPSSAPSSGSPDPAGDHDTIRI